MFADSAKIFIKSGKGGDGHVSFRRELYVAAGGPDGGDGGRGGDIIFEVDEGLNTLTDFRQVRRYIAEDGEAGGKRRCHGADAKSLILKVPEGTVIKDFETGKVIADMSGENRREVILRGGKGGLGNMNFATPTMQVPKFAKPGQPGKELFVILELKVIADVGLVGYPNAGKSTLLSRVSNAKPKIANYHFTTLDPHLGVVDVPGAGGFVMADIPGLIEGASKGIGLGHDFLRHIERTRLLIHVVDVSGQEGRCPIEDFKKINAEIAEYNLKLSEKPMVVFANKTDMATDEMREEFRNYIKSLNYELFEICAVTNSGLIEGIKRVTAMLDEIPAEEFVTDIMNEFEYNLQNVTFDDLVIDRVGDDFVLSGDEIDRLMYSIDLSDMDGIRIFEAKLRQKGIIERLKEEGLEEGKVIVIGNYEFEFYE